MGSNRLLITAILLIALSVIDVSSGSWGSGYQMVNMMEGGTMFGPGMMNRGHMRDMMQRMMPGMLPPGVKPGNLPDPNSLGARLLVSYCTQCHNLPSPAIHTAEEWPQVASRMFTRMSMMSGMMGIENPSQEEQRGILAYLKAHSMKSITSSALPSPESPGARLFESTCSQCHALPDPNLHTADEWPEVVERMRANMQSMNRRVITENEKKEIVGYLMNYAKK